MVLDGEHLVRRAGEPLHRVVQQVDVGDLQPRPRQGGGVHGEGVVLAGNLQLAGGEILHRVVAPPVAEFQLIGPAPIGQGDHLVSQADAEEGEPPPQLPDQLDDRPHILRVAGAVGKEQPVGLHVLDDLGRSVVGHHGDVAAPRVQGADDVQLDAAVDGGHGVKVIRGPGVPPLAAADPADGVPAD